MKNRYIFLFHCKCLLTRFKYLTNIAFSWASVFLSHVENRYNDTAKFAMGIKWAMLIKLLAWCQGQSKKSVNVLYSITNVLIFIILSKYCGGHKDLPSNNL